MKRVNACAAAHGGTAAAPAAERCPHEPEDQEEEQDREQDPEEAEAAMEAPAVAIARHWDDRAGRDPPGLDDSLGDARLVDADPDAGEDAHDDEAENEIEDRSSVHLMPSPL